MTLPEVPRPEVSREARADPGNAGADKIYREVPRPEVSREARADPDNAGADKI